MEFRVLGQVEALEGDERLKVAAGRQMALLALLLVHANRVVSTDRIMDELWGDDPPDSGAKTVAFHVSRLRDALAPGRSHAGQPGRDGEMLATEAGGYLLRVDPGRLDAARFERLAAEGRALLPADPEAARGRLSAALAEWRGSPYAQVADEAFARAEIARLEELRLRALEDAADADLALGRHADVIEPLRALVDEHPLRERARAQLMTALYRAGRQAEALRVYADGRTVLADELGIDPGPELHRLEGWILAQDPRLDAPVAGRTIRNPYKGLRPFDELDSGDFFGREALVDRLVERVGEVARGSHLLLVAGPSGSGKSSVVRAGLVPAIRSGALPGSARWTIASMLPGARPFGQLAAALREALPGLPMDLAESLEAGSLEAVGTVFVAGADGNADHVVDAPAAATCPLLLVIDQLEELFTVAGEGQASRFLELLGAALALPDSRLVVVATLRADHLAAPLGVPGLGDRIRVGTELVTPLTRDELERAIGRPAGRVGVALEPGLATEIVADVGSQPAALPLLQFALTELFERRDDARLTRSAYAALGGVAGALGSRAEEAWQGLDGEGREVARQLFLRLAAPGETGEPAGRRVARSDLGSLGVDDAAVDQVLGEFGRRRLLAFDRDPVTGAATVEVAHDALLGRWSRLAGWIGEARNDLSMRRRLADATADWEASGRDPDFLLAGSRLELFAAWSSSTDLRLDASEHALVQASVAARDRRAAQETVRAEHERVLERRAATRLRALAAVLAAAVLVASTLSVALYAQSNAAGEQATIALARERAAAAIGNLGTDPRLSLLLAWQAAATTADRGYVVEEALDALHWSLQASHVAYPPDTSAFGVRVEPGGARGIPLLAPERLMAIAAAVPGRDLTTAECRTYLHASDCPVAPAADGVPAGLGVYSGGGVVPIDRLAVASLAGTRVDVVAQLPVDVAPTLAALVDASGIEVQATQDDASGTILSRRVAGGDLPDMAIVARPQLVARLARAGLLVDLSGFADRQLPDDVAGAYLRSLVTIGPDGWWPAASGTLVGAPFATTHESLVWYPEAAFTEAGYRVPRTSTELTALVDRIEADGRAAWCLGFLGGAAGAADGVGMVEDALLEIGGRNDYDALAAGGTQFWIYSTEKAFDRLGDVLAPGHVLGGTDLALRTPPSIAAWPMFHASPDCWLHPGGGLDRLDWPKGETRRLAAFPVPGTAADAPVLVRGHAYTLVVFHDRPEVRRLVASLLDPASGPILAATLTPAGIVPIGATDGAVPEAVSLADAQRAGSFRVPVSDLVSPEAARALAEGVADYIEQGASSRNWMLDRINGAWRRANVGGQ